MPAFVGSLNQNEVTSAIYNMIISQYVFSNNIDGTYSSLVERARVDGSMFGDTKLYYATDAAKTVAFVPDQTSSPDFTNVLELHRPKAPECQAIEINVFRQIATTIDNYFTKRGFAAEGAFSDYNGTLLSWLRDTKAIYDSTTYNAFIGTNETSTGSQTQTITMPTETGEGVTDESTPVTTTYVVTEELNRLKGELIAKKLADILVAIKDPILGKGYNDYGFYRSYAISDLVVVWNADYFNEIEKIALPTIYNNAVLKDKLDEKNVLPAHYFGTVNTSGGTASSPNTTIRARIEKEYTVGGTTTHVFAGELIPAGATYLANETYTVDDSIIFKIMHKDSVPYMSGFEVSTQFINARNLSENHYLTFGHSTLEHLKNYPFVTVRAA